MTITRLLKTIYVFKKKELSAVLKEQSDGTLKVLSISTDREELKKFLNENGYEIAA